MEGDQFLYKKGEGYKYVVKMKQGFYEPSPTPTHHICARFQPLR